MNLKEYMSIPEIAKEFKVSSSTLRAYLARKQVVPEEIALRVGCQWLIKREWVESRYQKRD